LAAKYQPGENFTCTLGKAMFNCQVFEEGYNCSSFFSKINPNNHEKNVSDYEFVGCFADKGERAIPNFAGVVKSADACREKAEAKGHAIFGLQWGGECWTG